MAIIGKFTRQNDGTLLGGIKTLTIDIIAAFEPAARKSDKAPDYRLMADDCEIGAAWKRNGDEGDAYLSVRLDDPSFAAPINCRLVKSGVEHGFSLIWGTRPQAFLTASPGRSSGRPFSLQCSFQKGTHHDDQLH